MILYKQARVVYKIYFVHRELFLCIISKTYDTAPTVEVTTKVAPELNCINSKEINKGGTVSIYRDP